jgi:hypothetical protein
MVPDMVHGLLAMALVHVMAVVVAEVAKVSTKGHVAMEVVVMEISQDPEARTMMEIAMEIGQEKVARMMMEITMEIPFQNHHIHLDSHPQPHPYPHPSHHIPSLS